MDVKSVGLKFGILTKSQHWRNKPRTKICISHAATLKRKIALGYKYPSCWVNWSANIRAADSNQRTCVWICPAPGFDSQHSSGRTKRNPTGTNTSEAKIRTAKAVHRLDRTLLISGSPNLPSFSAVIVTDVLADWPAASTAIALTVCVPCETFSPGHEKEHAVVLVQVEIVLLSILILIDAIWTVGLLAATAMLTAPLPW